MEEFQTMETAELLDMLSKQTSEYGFMLGEGILDERFSGCQATIILLQSEIISRVSPTVIH